MTKQSKQYVDGYDAEFWNQSYSLLREAVLTHLDDCIREDDVAEEAILVEAIETAGKRLKEPARSSECAWQRAAWFAAKYRNLQALRGRVAAGEPVAEVAADYDVPVEWVERICASGFELLGRPEGP